MGVGADEPCPLPTNPALAQVARAMEDTGEAAWVVDDRWRFVYVSEDARSLWVDRDRGRLGSVAINHHIFSTESLRISSGWRFGLNTPDQWREVLRTLGGLVLADTPGGRDELRASIDPFLHDVVDELSPHDVSAKGFRFIVTGLPGPVPALMLATRIRDATGRLCGTALIGKPTASMSVLGGMAWERDLAHLERMEHFTRAGRHPAAILFADLEGSTALGQRLPTAAYFTVGRRIVRAADQCVIDAGGMVGRHLGDGVVAFFPAETSGSESAAARACIETARTLRAAMLDVAGRSDLSPEALVMRFGLHWGSTVFIGKINTIARAEVTALGTDVNTCARIEASATGGRILASKNLVERLAPGDASDLSIDPPGLVYTQLGDLASATDKARRDASDITVCEL